MTAPTAESKRPPKPGLSKALVVLGVAFAACTCLGVVSAVAVPAFIGYVKRQKVAEGIANLDVLAGSVQRYCSTTGGYPPPAGPMPEVPTSVAQSPDFRADATYALIGFDPGIPVYFSYAIEPSASGVDLVAYGDLDGDGTRSVRRVRCGPDCSCAPPEVRDELE
jgi:hypothetical protein